MDIAQIEQAALAAWPALQEHNGQTGLLRFAAGVSRRANSMNPRIGQRVCADALQTETEAFFWPKKLPAIVRVMAEGFDRAADLAGLDQSLANSGYHLEGHTSLMLRALTPASSQLTGSALACSEVNLEQWLFTWYALAGKDRSDFLTHQAMLNRIDGEARFLVLQTTQSEALASGFAVLLEGLVGIFGIATHRDYLRQGCASTLLETLLHWAQQKGARYAYLQVEADNSPACNLYLKLGFREFYNYWYRVKPVPGDTPWREVR